MSADVITIRMVKIVKPDHETFCIVGIDKLAEKCKVLNLPLLFPFFF